MKKSNRKDNIAEKFFVGNKWPAQQQADGCYIIWMQKDKENSELLQSED
jgi:hypothetical protein